MPVIHAIMFIFHIAIWIGEAYKKKWPEKNLNNESAQFLGCLTAIAFLIPASLFVSGIVWTVDIIRLLIVKFDFLMLCKGIFSSGLVIFSSFLFLAGINFIYFCGETSVTPAIVTEKRREFNKKRMYCVCGEHVKPGQKFCITFGISLY